MPSSYPIHDQRAWLYTDTVILPQEFTNIAISLAGRRYTKTLLALAKSKLIILEKHSGLSVISFLAPIAKSDGWLTIPGPRTNLYEISALSGYQRIEFVPRQIPGKKILFLTTEPQEITDQVRHPILPRKFWTFYLKTLLVQTKRLPDPIQATLILEKRLAIICQTLLENDDHYYP